MLGRALDVAVGEREPACALSQLVTFLVCARDRDGRLKLFACLAVLLAVLECRGDGNGRLSGGRVSYRAHPPEKLADLPDVSGGGALLCDTIEHPSPAERCFGLEPGIH